MLSGVVNSPAESAKNAMHAVLAPGVWRFRRSRFAAKAAIISSAFALPLGLLGVIFYRHTAAQLDAVAQERLGTALSTPLAQTLVAADQARQVALMQAAGAASQAVAAQAGAARREAAVAQLQQTQGRLALDGLAAGLKLVDAAQGQLAPADQGLIKVFASQSKLTATLLKLQEQVSDLSGLTHDPDADT